MASPTWHSTTVTDFGADATNHVANYPATVNAGEFLLYVVAFDGSTTTITTPAGLTKLTGGPTTDPVAGIYVKRAEGTEGGATVDFITSNAQRGSVHILRVSNWAGYLDALRWTAANGATAITLELGLTGVNSKDYLLVAAEVKSSTTAFGTAPSGYINENKTNVSEDVTLSAAVATATKALTNRLEAVPAFWNSTSSATFAYFTIVIPGVGQTHIPRAQAAIGL
jgi:hypothetical protein